MGKQRYGDHYESDLWISEDQKTLSQRMLKQL